MIAESALSEFRKSLRGHYCFQASRPLNKRANSTMRATQTPAGAEAAGQWFMEICHGRPKLKEEHLIVRVRRGEV